MAKLAKNISLDQVFAKMRGYEKAHSRDILWSISTDLRDLVIHFSQEFKLSPDEARKLALRLAKNYLSSGTHRIQ